MPPPALKKLAIAGSKPAKVVPVPTGLSQPPQVATEATTNSTIHRIRISETMQANKNASSESFADELAREYAHDPEASAWLAAHREELKTANADGSVPRSTQELVKPNELQLYNDDLVVDSST